MVGIASTWVGHEVSKKVPQKEAPLDEILRQGRDLRETARSTRQGVPQVSARSGASTPSRPERRTPAPYEPPGRRTPEMNSRRVEQRAATPYATAGKLSPDLRARKVDDGASIKGIQDKGRQIREMMRINSTPRSARTGTPVKGRQPHELLLRPGVECRVSNCTDEDKWSNQTSSRSLGDASTTAPSQTSARSLRCTPAPSPQSSSRSLRTSTSGLPRSAREAEKRPPRVPNGRAPPGVPRVPGASPKLKASPSKNALADTKRSEKDALCPKMHDVEPVPSSVLLLPERLAEAARHGDVEMINDCISELPDGAPVSVKDKYGWTSLHYAAQGGYFEVCQLLLEARGDANAELPDFSTPIMLAVEEGNIPVAELLLQHGARTRSKDEAGFTAMDRCAPEALLQFKSCVQQYM